MKLTLKKNPQVVEMFKLMASKDRSVAQPAREAFAAFIQNAIMPVVDAEAALGKYFSTQTFDYGTPSSIPLAPLFDLKQKGFIKLWSQARAGGLATAQNVGGDELFVMTHNINAAVSFKLDYVRAARADVVAAYLNLLAQEVLMQQELDSATVITATAAQATWLNNNGQSGYQVLRTKTQGTVTVQDFNALGTLAARIHRPNIGGTPAGATRSITTLVGSPEFLEVLKNSAFQPQNLGNTPIPSSDQFRDNIYNAGGSPSWYGTELDVIYDMGVGQAYNILFGDAAGNTQYVGYNGAGVATFDPAAEQVVFAINRREDFLVRMVETSPDSNATLSISADDQWSNRSKTIGFFADCNEGRISLDGRNICALVY